MTTVFLLTVQHLDVMHTTRVKTSWNICNIYTCSTTSQTVLVPQRWVTSLLTTGWCFKSWDHPISVSEDRNRPPNILGFSTISPDKPKKWEYLPGVFCARVPEGLHFQTPYFTQHRLFSLHLYFILQHFKTNLSVIMYFDFQGNYFLKILGLQSL